MRNILIGVLHAFFALILIILNLNVRNSISASCFSSMSEEEKQNVESFTMRPIIISLFLLAFSGLWVMQNGMTLDLYWHYFISIFVSFALLYYSISLLIKTYGSKFVCDHDLADKIGDKHTEIRTMSWVLVGMSFTYFIVSFVAIWAYYKDDKHQTPTLH